MKPFCITRLPTQLFLEISLYVAFGLNIGSEILKKALVSHQDVLGF
jgi:hypothetical protein